MAYLESAIVCVDSFACFVIAPICFGQLQFPPPAAAREIAQQLLSASFHCTTCLVIFYRVISSCKASPLCHKIFLQKDENTTLLADQMKTLIFLLLIIPCATCYHWVDGVVPKNRTKDFHCPGRYCGRSDFNESFYSGKFLY